MKKHLFFFMAACFISLCLNAQNTNAKNNTTFGLNIGHAVTISVVSKMISNSVSYFPVDINLNHTVKGKLGISGLLMYRMDKDGDYFRTHEFGFAVGPSYISDNLKGFWADFKIGYARAFGSDYSNADYSRSDLVIQPELGYNLCFPSKLILTFGIGVQSLHKITENPARDGIWDWNSTGKLSHYYLPVVNISLGFMP